MARYAIKNLTNKNNQLLVPLACHSGAPKGEGRRGEGVFI